ncbi:hypothetical protein FOZ63_014715, partial [Perkinsus olseni]
TWRFWLGLLYFTFPVNIMMLGINDMADDALAGRRSEKGRLGTRGTPVAYYQTMYQPAPPGTPQMAPQSPAGSVRSVGSFAPIGYPQSYGPPLQSPVYTGVGPPYPSPPSQPAPGSYPSQPQQQPAMGDYAPVYQLPYGAIPQQQQQQQHSYVVQEGRLVLQMNFNSALQRKKIPLSSSDTVIPIDREPDALPSGALARIAKDLKSVIEDKPVAAAYYGAYLGNPAMMRGGGSPTSSVRSMSSDGGVPQSPMLNPVQMSPMNMAPPMVLQRESSGNMILPPVGYFVRDAENVDPDNLCYADIRHNKPGPPSTGDSARGGNYNNSGAEQQQEAAYRRQPERGHRVDGARGNAYSTPERPQQPQRDDGYHRGGRHHHHKQQQQQQLSQQQGAAAHEGPGKTLRTLLQELDEEDENCISIVRRIHKFGFKSPVFLREYFEEYGQVRKVLVAHSRQLQPGPNDTTRTRSRPASLGFVLMADSESVQRILADGPVHMVADVEITVHPFENRHPEKESQGESSQDQQSQ